MSESLRTHVATGGRPAVRQDRYLELFRELSPLVGARGVEEIASTACDLISRLLDVRACSLLLQSSCGCDLTMAAATHIAPGEWDSIRVRRGEGICGAAFESGEAILLRSAADFRRFELEPDKRYGRPSCIVVPVGKGEGAVGVLNVANPRKSRPFGKRDLELLEAVAGFIAGGIEGARLHGQVVEMHDRLAEILDNLHVAVLALDSELRVTHCNHRFAEFARRPAGEILTKPLRKCLDTQIFNVCHRLIRESADTDALRQERFEGETGGAPVRVQITVSKFSGSCDDAGAHLVMFEDIGRDEEIRRLREADSIKRSFIRIISHELRTPLTVLQGAMPLLKVCENANGDRAPQLRKVQELLRPNVQRLTNTVNSILDVVEIENGKLELTLAPIDLNRMIEERMRYLEERARSREISWRAELDETLPPVAADNHRLRQALYELVDNAIKFSEPGSKVRLKTGRADGMAGVWIANRGETISPERRHEVFEKFYQLDHEMTRKSNGCGLGLYLVRNIAALHGGSVEIVDGAPDETEFLMRLPFAEREADAASA